MFDYSKIAEKLPKIEWQYTERESIFEDSLKRRSFKVTIFSYDGKRKEDFLYTASAQSYIETDPVKAYVILPSALEGFKNPVSLENKQSVVRAYTDVAFNEGMDVAYKAGGIASKAKEKAALEYSCSVLSCLLSDQRAGLDSFEEFCANFGYDTDSRKAYKTWEDCRDTALRLFKIFTHAEIEDLETLLQDY